MEQKSMFPRYEQILKCFACLPQKILTLHGADNVTEFVLHTLCNERCLNLSKAAYFVDNEDFNCLKGIAGFDGTNEYDRALDLWVNPDDFTNHMKSCNFNNKVRAIHKDSARKSKREQKDIMETLAKELSMNNPTWYGWDNKHANQGIVIFELPEQQKEIEQDLLHGLCLLGFCPIF